jgi:hypothetical protein
MMMKKYGYLLMFVGLLVLLSNWRRLGDFQNNNSTNGGSLSKHENSNNGCNCDNSDNKNQMLSTLDDNNQKNTIFQPEPKYINRIKEVQTKLLYNCHEKIVALQVLEMIIFCNTLNVFCFVTL